MCLRSRRRVKRQDLSKSYQRCNRNHGLFSTKCGHFGGAILCRSKLPVPMIAKRAEVKRRKILAQFLDLTKQWLIKLGQLDRTKPATLSLT